MMTTGSQTILRPFSFDDAQAVVNVCNAWSQALLDRDDTDLDAMMNEWTSPSIEPEEVLRVVENNRGEIIGYIEVWDISKPHVIKYIWGILHPDYWNESLYQQMLTWAENCARERINLAPEGTRVSIKQGVPNKDRFRKTVMETVGYELIRHFLRMQIELDNAPLQPRIPEGLNFVSIDIENELKAAVLAIDEAFEDHWGHVHQPEEELIAQWRHHIENDADFDPSLWYLAKDGDQIAGICRCSGKTVEDPNMGWINHLCVLKPWRRRGLGKALLLTAFNEFYSRGKQRVGLAVDADSLTNATQLYEKAGMHVTTQYDTYEKELRTGTDLMTV